MSVGAGSDWIVLVPGIFGFGTFGSSGGPRIDYFAAVKEVLSRTTGIPPTRIRSAEPPPTGAIAHRVAELIGELETILADPGTPPAARVHLVGHSTGGVDIRLLLNEGFTGFTAFGVDEQRRARVAARVGSVVSLSAPFYGTPCAVKLAPEFKGLVAALSLWNVLDHGGALTGAFGPFAATTLGVIEAVARDPSTNETVIALLGRLGLDTATVGQLVRFRQRIVSDDGLMHDLSPGGMAEINAGLAPDRVEIRSYVTVAPQPSAGDFGGLERRAIYLLLYSATSDAGFSPLSFPEGPWLAGDPDPALLGQAPRTCDGVVPSSSQTVDGVAAGVVLADHEDVIGHFDGQENTTVFKSGSGFTYARFARLWSDIGGRL